MFDSRILLSSRAWTPLRVHVCRLFQLRVAERMRRSGGGVRYAGVTEDAVWLAARARCADTLCDAIEWEGEILLRHGLDGRLSDAPIPQTWPRLIPVSSNSVAAEYCGLDRSGRSVLGFDSAVRDDGGARIWTSTIFAFDDEGALVDAEIELFPEDELETPESLHLDRRMEELSYSPRNVIAIRPFTIEFEGLQFGFVPEAGIDGCGFSVLPGSKKITLPHLQVWFDS